MKKRGDMKWTGANLFSARNLMADEESVMSRSGSFPGKVKKLYGRESNWPGDVCGEQRAVGHWK